MPDIGNLFVIAAPSGAGKTTLVKALTDSLSDITVSISHTTRGKRPNEVDGIHYYFIDSSVFQQMIKQNDFLEYAEIFGHHYGTSRRLVTETLAKGIDVILEIDWQGHQQIKALFPNAISIFILPPSLADLKTRLETRNQDDPHIIQIRLKDARDTLSHLHEFDFIVVNDDFDRAVTDLKTITLAERLRQRRQAARLAPLIKQLETSS